MRVYFKAFEIKKYSNLTEINVRSTHTEIVESNQISKRVSKVKCIFGHTEIMQDDELYINLAIISSPKPNLRFFKTEG